MMQLCAGFSMGWVCSLLSVVIVPIAIIIGVLLLSLGAVLAFRYLFHSDRGY